MPDPQPTPPAQNDWVEYHYSDGRVQPFDPADPKAVVVNREAVAIGVTRPGGNVGQWLPRTAPVTQPASPPPPVVVVPPVITRIVAVKNAPNRGTGINLADPKWRQGDQIVVRNAWLENWNMNISGMNLPVPFLLERVYSLRAWRDDPAQAFKGQTCWIGKSAGGIVRDSVFAYAGWEPGRPANRRSEFAHGFYAYWDCGPVTFDGCVFAHNPNAGVQLKNAGTIQNCLFFDCGTAILSLRGPTKVRNCLIVDGHRYAMVDAAGNILSWTGDTAVATYGALDIDDTWVFGGPLQSAADLTPAKSSDLFAFEGSANYGPRPQISDGKNAEWQTPAGKPDAGAPQGAKWTIGPNVRCAGWKGGTARAVNPKDQNTIPPMGVRDNAPLTADAYSRIVDLVDEAISDTTRAPSLIVADAMRAAGTK